MYGYKATNPPDFLRGGGPESNFSQKLSEMSKWKKMQQYAKAFGHETMYHPQRGSEDFKRWRNPLAYVPVGAAIAARDIAKGTMNYVYGYTNPPPAVPAAEETDNPN